jgi:hypothetical protein
MNANKGTNVIVCELDTGAFTAYHNDRDWYYVYPRLIDSELSYDTTRYLDKEEKDLVIFAEDMQDFEAINKLVKRVANISYINKGITYATEYEIHKWENSKETLEDIKEETELLKKMNSNLIVRPEFWQAMKIMIKETEQ